MMTYCDMIPHQCCLTVSCHVLGLSHKCSHSFPLDMTEIKIDKKHVEGSTTMNPAEMATIEPLTPNTNLQQGPPTVEVTKSDRR